MIKFNNTLHAQLLSYGANQNKPYRVYRQGFIASTILKSRKLKEEIKKIVLKYYPDFNNKDILQFLKQMNNNGCTYAHMANVIINSFKDQEELFEQAFGYSIYNEDGTYAFDKVMTELYTFLSTYADITIVKQERYKFSSMDEATKKLLGRPYDEDADMHLIRDYILDGVDNEGNLLFKSKQYEQLKISGSYTSIAKKIFGTSGIVSKEELTKLLKENNMSFSIRNSDNPQKLSGLINQSDKWMNIFFDDLGLDSQITTSKIDIEGYKEHEVHTMLMSGSLRGLLIGISTSVNSNVMATDGTKTGWISLSNDKVGHAMTFYGFDQDDNFLVLSWGKIYMIPKEFYNQLEYNCTEIVPKVKQNDRQL